MKRILQITDSMGMGGIQAFIMNVYRNIDREKYQFDFLLHQKMENGYDDEILKMGGNIYYIPSRHEGIIKNRKALEKFFSKHPEYTVVHQHESSLTYIEPLVIAKKYNVPVRIMHSHSTRASGSKIHTLLHKINIHRIKNVATNYFACGELAGKWMYNGSGVEKKVIIVNNGIDIKKYSFDETIRKKMRIELGLDKKFVIGNVGRFSEVKNHTFLIDVFNEFVKLYPDSELVLVGDGDLQQDMKNKVKELSLSDKVQFLGIRRDVHTILMSFDYVVIPSLYEGFPVTAIEAQAIGVPCLISDSVTKDVVINNNVKMLSLRESADVWADQIYKNKKVQRNSNKEGLIKKGFDIATTTDYLLEIYKE
ncbi:glycosyltransferase family 1 protein [Eubacterium ramulus]